MDAYNLHCIKPGSKVKLRDIDPSKTLGLQGPEDQERAAADALRDQNIGVMQQLQYRLWAEAKRSLLIVLQGMDCSGKDGTTRRVLGPLNPQGVRVSSFKKPTDEELSHDFLWRVHKVVPARGMIGVFNRSHYEDVLVVRVLNLVPKGEWSLRYDHINDFEKLLTESGTRILKFMLHISKDEQKERLQARLDDPEKGWKFALGDLDTRKRWDEYMDAYEAMLERCSTPEAPWFVIPADKKWYRNWAISSIVRRELELMDPKTPAMDAELKGLKIE
ncbi:MAG: polyphosphate kinase 2 family protein [Phycisphaerales bacterium]|nr:polyphosphate kinase 2 family protein [Phycisphaerales bacterium]MCB9835386.1 polyphosphate kinase 2 family protein [Phycisphaera sp.]